MSSNSLVAELNSIKYLIRSKSFRSLIIFTVKLIHDIDISENRQINFWNLITLYRWIIEYGTDQLILGSADREYILRLFSKVNKVEDIYNRAYIDKNGFDVDFMMQQIANQQSDYQLQPSIISFARQQRLFTIDNKYDQKFIAAYGMSISEWLKELLFTHLAITINFEKKKVRRDHLGYDYFRIVNSDKRLIKNKLFLETISINLNDLRTAREKVSNSSKVKSKILQIYDQQTLSLYPFYSIESNYYLIHRKLFAITANFTLYDLMKKSYGNEFTTDFGKSLEKYVKLGLDELKSDYVYDETRTGSKSVDFVVSGRLLIECKAIETPTIFRVEPSQNKVVNFFKKDILKSLNGQMYEESKLIKSNNSNVRVIGIIITYKETNFSYGEKCFHRLFGRENTAVFEDYINRNDIFILSLHEWDILVNTCKYNQIDIYETLCKASDREIQNKKYYLSMDLENSYKRSIIDLSYLKSAGESLNYK